MARILIIGDDDAFRAAFAETLSDLGHQPIEAASGRAGLAVLAESAPAAVFLDYRMAGMDGIEVLRRLSTSGSAVPVVMLTAFADSTSTIAAMKLGAFEHLTKPVARADIERLLKRVLASSPGGTSAEAPTHGEGERLLGTSIAMREVHKLIGRAAATASTVLITGESGTGKELVARLLHESSDRAARPFIAVNCAAIPRDLLESELFGHVKGAFTGAISNRIGAFQQANGGTLLLDEIGDMGLDMQAKLLRVLEERTVTPVGASRAEKLDLRVIDIPLLARYFLAEAAEGDSFVLSEAAIEKLIAYAWPGNVRELRNAMERLAIVVRSGVVTSDDLEFLGSDAKRGIPDFDLGLLDGELGPAVEALERSMIRTALAACGGNRAEAARRLGIHRQLLYKKLKQYGLE